MPTTEPHDALAQFLRALEDYINAYNGLPGPLVVALQSGHENCPLAVPCEPSVETTNELLFCTQKDVHARPVVTDSDLFNAVASTGWLRSNCRVADVVIESMREAMGSDNNQV